MSGAGASTSQVSAQAFISPSAHVYERLSDVGSPAMGSPRRAQYAEADYRNSPFGDESDSDGDNYYNRRKAPTWVQRIKALGGRAEAPAASNYLTLIPLSDERLKPRHTALLVSCLLVLALALAAGVFVVVPRGVTVGSIQVRSSHMSFNTSKSTYQIILTATIPIFNPNYFPVQLSGDLVVSFYDQQAGATSLQPEQIAARAFPQVIEMDMDASSVPQQYLFTIYTQCFTFPERIIFFLTGKLESRYLGWVSTLPDIDNYFIVPCTNAPDHHEPPPGPPKVRPPHSPAPPPRPSRPPPRLSVDGSRGGGQAGLAGGSAAGDDGAAGASRVAEEVSAGGSVGVGQQGLLMAGGVAEEGAELQ
ncbi:Transmembrane protein 106B, partial [Tetrabaena socialis]